jgi:hypothetical protein
MLRHTVDRGIIDEESGELHDVEIAWRALANLQIAEEQRLGLPPSRGSVSESKSNNVDAGLRCNDCDEMRLTVHVRRGLPGNPYLCSECFRLAVEETF